MYFLHIGMEYRTVHCYHSQAESLSRLFSSDEEFDDRVIQGCRSSQETCRKPLCEYQAGLALMESIVSASEVAGLPAAGLEGRDKTRT